MKKIYLIGLVFANGLTAQIGVNTTSPQEEIHIAGSSSTIRIEGLNAANNAKNLGANANSRVFVNSFGDLVLGNQTSDVEVVFNPYNYLNDPEDTGGSDSNVITQNGTGTGYQDAGWPRQTGLGFSYFTLTKKAIVEINYSLSWKIQKNGSGLIDDGAARIFQTYLYLIQTAGPVADGPYPKIVSTDADGVSLTIGKALGISGQFYNNMNSGDGAYDNFFNNGSDYVKLKPGSYQPMFAAQISVNTTGGTGAVKAFVGGGNDEVQVVAHYYN